MPQGHNRHTSRRQKREERLLRIARATKGRLVVDVSLPSLDVIADEDTKANHESILSNERVICRYCQSENVIKFGKYKCTQRYYCKECQRKFNNKGAPENHQYPVGMIQDALRMRSRGMSIQAVRRSLVIQYGYTPVDATILRWEGASCLDYLK